jgi:hypothetical protein
VGGAGDTGDPTETDKKKTKAKKELTAAEKQYQDVMETNAIIDQAVQDAAADRVIKEGELQAAREEATAQVQQQIDDMEFELSLRGKSNQEIERETALRRAGTAATDEQRQRIVELTDELGKSTQKFGEFSVASADMAIGGVSDVFYDMATGAKSFGDSFTDAVEGFAKGMARIASEALATLLVLKTFDAVMPGFSEFFISMRGGKFHKGGVVGSGGSPVSINPLLLGAAPRYHTGGFAGLRSNEVAAVLEKGEEVLTDDDPRHTRNGGRRRGGNTIVNVEHNIINHSGAEVQTSERVGSGGKVIIDTIIGAVAGDIARHGVVGKAIGQRFGVQPVGVPRG